MQLHSFSAILISKLCFVFVLAIVSNADGQVTLADARGDFVPGTNAGDPGIIPAAGSGEWRYMASDTMNPTLDPNGLDILPWDPPNSSYQKFTTGGSSNAVGVQIVESDEIRMHPAAFGRPPSFDVVRWIAGPGEAGQITIAGNVRKSNAAQGGGGVTADIYVDGVSVFSKTVAGTDTVGYAFDITATVLAGSTVDFVVGPNGFDSFDTTAVKATITQEDNTPPTVFCTVAKNLLWPPNHKLINVGLDAVAMDESDPDPAIEVFVYGDEDDEEPTGDEIHSPDAKNIGLDTLRLRAERKGNSDGRVYLIVVVATDAAGNQGFDCCTVGVPKSKSKKNVKRLQEQAEVAEDFCRLMGEAPPWYFEVGDGPETGPKQ